VPSFTSGSEFRAAKRAISILLAVVFVYCAGLEVATRRMFARSSHIQRRIHQDLISAKSVVPQVSNERRTILMVGNSLLLLGVHPASLKKELAPNYVVTLLPIENTQFDDWYFGLRRLFAEGSRPSIVVICLSTRQMMSHATNGEYFAYYLMRESDLRAVKKESQLDNTMASTYFFANRSAWLGSRAEIRNWLLQKIMPNLGRLISYFPGKTPPMPSEKQVVAGVVPHLIALDLLCRANGARLVAVIPPTLSRDDSSADVKESVERYGIPVLVPLSSSDVSPSEFFDGFHLNPQGAARFTECLVSALLRTLNSN
jgi:hypothetical protein